MSNVFIGCPTHDGRIDFRTARSLYMSATNQKHATVVAVNQGSLLANNCNQLWCMALNAREKHQVTWFAMLHSDVIPEPFWLDKMIMLAEEHNADLLSAVIPIKDDRGLTSTALGSEDPFNVVMRLTMKQVLHHAMPGTFDLEDVKAFLRNTLVGEPEQLLVNTGCMVCRLDREWSDRLFFQITDTIREENGVHYAMVEPEDWFFSRIVAEVGGKVMATKQVQIKHVGLRYFDSFEVWGHDMDPHFVQSLPRPAPLFYDNGVWTEEAAKKNGYPVSKKLVEFMRSNLTYDSVIDFGCGDCFYIAELFKRGYDVFGVDGYIPEKNFITPDFAAKVKVADLTKPLDLGFHGHVISIEVGEHIPVEFEQIFIDNLCRHCSSYSTLILSWAIPGQGGIGHVNCRENAYVIEQIEKRGFAFNKLLTYNLRASVTERNVSYLKNTLMVFDKV